MMNISNFLLDNGDIEHSGFISQLFFALYLIFAVIAAVAVIYAIYLGLSLGAASDEQKRAKAKKRIINVIASIFIIVILVVVLAAIEYPLHAARQPEGPGGGIIDGGNGNGNGPGQNYGGGVTQGSNAQVNQSFLLQSPLAARGSEENIVPVTNFVWSAQQHEGISNRFGARSGGSPNHQGVDIRTIPIWSPGGARSENATATHSRGQPIIAPAHGTIHYVRNTPVTITANVGGNHYSARGHDGFIVLRSRFAGSNYYFFFIFHHVELRSDLRSGNVQTVTPGAHLGWTSLRQGINTPYLHFETRVGNANAGTGGMAFNPFFGDHQFRNNAFEWLWEDDPIFNIFHPMDLIHPDRPTLWQYRNNLPQPARTSHYWGARRQT